MAHEGSSRLRFIVPALFAGAAVAAAAAFGAFRAVPAAVPAEQGVVEPAVAADPAVAPSDALVSGPRFNELLQDLVDAYNAKQSPVGTYTFDDIVELGLNVSVTSDIPTAASIASSNNASSVSVILDAKYDQYKAKTATHTITLYDEDGNQISSAITANRGSKLSDASLPTSHDSKTITGWYKKGDSSKTEVPGTTAIYSDLSLVAIYAAAGGSGGSDGGTGGGTGGSGSGGSGGSSTDDTSPTNDAPVAPSDDSPADDAVADDADANDSDTDGTNAGSIDSGSDDSSDLDLTAINNRILSPFIPRVALAAPSTPAPIGTATNTDPVNAWATLTPITVGSSTKLALTLKTTLSSFTLAANSEGLFAGLRNLTKIRILGTTLSSNTYYTDATINVIDGSIFDTSDVIYMGSMFEDCSSLQNLHLVDWNVSKVVDMHSMFEGCVKLEALQLKASSGAFVHAGVVRIDRFFMDCERLIAVGNDPTQFGTNTTGSEKGYYKWLVDWADYQTKLTAYNNAVQQQAANPGTTVTIPAYPTEPIPRDYSSDCWQINDWDVSTVKDLSQLFYNCESLYDIELSGWKFKGDWEPQAAITSGSTPRQAEDLLGIPAEDTPAGVPTGWTSTSTAADPRIGKSYRVNVWYLFDGTGLVKVTVDSDKRLYAEIDSDGNVKNKGDLYDMAAYPLDCELIKV